MEARTAAAARVATTAALVERDVKLTVKREHIGTCGSMKAVERTTVTSPADSAGFLSRLSYDYVRPLLAKGIKEPLQISHLPKVPSRDEASKRVRVLENAWTRECALAADSGKLPRLWRAVMRAYAYDFLEHTMWAILEGLSIIGQPLLLQRLVNWVQEQRSYSEGATLAGGLTVLALAQAVIHHKNFYVGMRTGWNLRIGVIGMLHGKLLRLTSASLRRAGGSAVYNLVASDVLRFDQLAPFTAPGVCSFMELALTFLIIMSMVGTYAALAGVSTALLSIALQSRLGKYFGRLRARTAKHTDDRLKQTSELLSGILSVKIYGWESALAEKIGRLRLAEHTSILRSQFLKALTVGLSFATPPLSSLVLFTVVYLRDQDLDVDKAYAVLGLLAALRISVGKNFSKLMEAGPECFVALARMTAFMQLDESVGSDVPVSRMDNSPVLTLQNASFGWPSDACATPDASTHQTAGEKPALKGLNLQLHKGEVLLVMGTIGCGKSALLQAVLGELTTLEGSYFTTGKVGYAPQESWIMAGTLQSNVTLGASGQLHAARYRAVLEACELVDDIRQLAHGDETEIGEKGVNLSGGQKARVTLARVLYAQPALALLDDPLAAVDPSVANHLFHTAIRQGLSRTAVVLVTHQQQFARHADRLLMLNADGTVQGYGTPRELESLGLIALEDSLPFEAPHLDPVEGAFPAELPRMAADEKTSAGPAANRGPQFQGSASSTSRAEEKAGAERGRNPQEESKLVLKEDRDVGRVSLDTWVNYVRAAGWHRAALVLLFFMSAQALLMLSDYWLKVWIEDDLSAGSYAGFAGLCGSTCLAAWTAAGLFFASTMQASSSMHRWSLASLLRAPMWFFAANPLGRILNRFSSDLAQVDELLPPALFDAVQMILMVSGAIVLVCAVIPYLIILVPFLLLAMTRLRNYVTASMNELKRLDNLTRSPVFNSFNATLHGLVVMRAFQLERHMHARFLELLESNAQAWFWWFICNRWLGFWLDMLCFVIVASVSFAAVVLRDTIDPGLIGFALVYAMSLSGLMQYCFRQQAMAETLMTSSERLLHYAFKLPSEINEQSSDAEVRGYSLEDVWPEHGHVSFEKISVRYRSDLPLILNDVTAEIAPGQKLGVVGRTGAGKSSLLLALARLNETCGGRVLIDGVDLAHLSVQQVRSAMAVIPQQPHLFSGTLRFNLDPFDQYSNEALWVALKAVQLHHLLQADQDLDGSEASGERLEPQVDDSGLEKILSMKVEEGGSNLSVGQRQLLSMARAMLYGRKIILIDEATANVDFETDSIIQRTLRDTEPFRSCTLIIIAHRIQTIIDSDKILVLAGGRVAQFGSPDELLEDQCGIFKNMASGTALLHDALD
ncbi:hypothetical protein CYMTET_4965 [Cymbomonas tetramitiformis]|uniref:Uncharacterized protein n=1 Tax=Cymbomonas tetramitiformis TaxID=36881 RepID=A0AAE0H0B3_9CHLO|nr:hypothetical protein CYMTET_4965 [Cymbomonas tetramitiformis]|eukprot:gene447-824_t